MNLLFLIKKWLKSAIRWMFLSYLGPRTSAILVDLDGLKLLVPATDLSLARSLSKSGGYNKPLVEFLVQQVSAPSAVLFIGTHIGSVLIPVAKRCRAVVGIEANPETFKLLEANLKLNNITNAKILNRAAFDQKGDLSFLATRDNTGGSKITPGGPQDILFRLDPAKKITVAGDRVDDLLENGDFDLVVMDIEGSETKALKGMPRILGFAKKLVLEIHPLSIEKIARIPASEFFEALPPLFFRAHPINTPALKSSYERSEFLAMYAEIAKNYWMSGVDVMFEASLQTAVSSSDTIHPTPR